MTDWEAGEVRGLPIVAFGERYRRYRLPDAAAEAALARSLSRYGQIAPLVVCLREETPEVLDGFKRMHGPTSWPLWNVRYVTARTPRRRWSGFWRRKPGRKGCGAC
jgi:hypothetical protein